MSVKFIFKMCLKDKLATTINLTRISKTSLSPQAISDDTQTAKKENKLAQTHCLSHTPPSVSGISKANRALLSILSSPGRGKSSPSLPLSGWCWVALFSSRQVLVCVRVCVHTHISRVETFCFDLILTVFRFALLFLAAVNFFFCFSHPPQKGGGGLGDVSCSCCPGGVSAAHFLDVPPPSLNSTGNVAKRVADRFSNCKKGVECQFNRLGGRLFP